MIDARTKIAAIVLVGVLSTLATAQAAQAARAVDIRYACDEGQRLLVRQSAKVASVQFADRSYELRQARSSIGRKYLSPIAALLIDGPSAVFVAQDRLQLGRCLEAGRTPSGS